MSYNPSGGGGSPSWSSVTGKPSTFPPETPQAISHITGLQAALDGKQAAGSYQPLATVLTNTTAAFTTAQETKLAGIATGATANTGTVTSVSGAGTVSGLTLTGTVTGSGSITLGGTLSTTSSAISDFNSATRAQVEAELIAGTNVTITPGSSGATRTLTIASSGGGGSSGPYAAMILASDYTLTSTTAAQKLFNLGTSSGGAITLAAGIYRVYTQLYITGMSATSGNGTFNILGAGTATIGGSMRHSIGIDNTTPTNAGTQTGAFSLNTSTNNMATNATGTSVAVTIQGLMVVTVGGTIIPSIALTTAAAATVRAPSHIIIEQVSSSSGTTTIGTVT